MMMMMISRDVFLAKQNSLKSGLEISTNASREREREREREKMTSLSRLFKDSVVNDYRPNRQVATFIHH